MAPCQKRWEDRGGDWGWQGAKVGGGLGLAGAKVGGGLGLAGCQVCGLAKCQNINWHFANSQ